MEKGRKKQKYLNKHSYKGKQNVPVYVCLCGCDKKVTVGGASVSDIKAYY